MYSEPFVLKCIKNNIDAYHGRSDRQLTAPRPRDRTVEDNLSQKT